MFIRSLVLAVFIAGCATARPQLTPLEEQKLDPALQRLVLGTPASRTEYDITPGPTGEEVFGVLVRTDNVDDIRHAGCAVTSAFGDIAVVRVTLEQIHLLVSLPSVKNVMNGSKHRPL
jgi:hypothetical protein